MYTESTIMVMNIQGCSYIEPQQQRSIERFNEVLKTAELLYVNSSLNEVTIQNISKLSGLKRPSIYKFFPNNESILEALSHKQVNSLLLLIKNNLDNIGKKNETELIKLIIDVTSIYVNNNLPLSNLVLNRFSKPIFFNGVKNHFSVERKVERNRLKMSLTIILSCMDNFIDEEGCIPPSAIAEIKKASLIYFSN